MSAQPSRRPFREASLFPPEAEIARRLGQTPQQWAATAKILERHGLQPVDPLLGGRYWPAVEAFFDRRYGLSSIEPVHPDGGENLDALR